jgi:hypothetical protein
LPVDHRSQEETPKAFASGQRKLIIIDLSFPIRLPRRSLGEGGSFDARCWAFDVRCLLFGSCAPPIPSFAPCFNALTLQRFNAATM